MLSTYMVFPDIDPIAISIGPLALRWYSLAYIIGVFFTVYWSKIIAKQSPFPINSKIIDSALTPAILGIIIGGRLGFVLLYDPAFYLSNPIEALKVWKGGMSFHGGTVGFLLALAYTAKRHKIPAMPFIDIVIPSAGVGLFCGRIANFVNGELWGRPTDVAWAMIFPHVDNLPRHPSQIYEALLEGVMIFIVLNLLAFRSNTLNCGGRMSGYFAILYTTSRFFIEFYRTPETVFMGVTLGQWYSIPLFIFGLWLVNRSRKHKIPQ